MKAKRKTAWLLSLLMVFSLLVGTSKRQVYANEPTYSVNFGEGSWTVGNTTVTVTNRTGTEELSTDDIISLTSFDAETMEVKVEATSGFWVTLAVADGTTSLSARTTEGGYPNETLTFSVVAKSSDEGGGGGNVIYKIQ